MKTSVILYVAQAKLWPRVRWFQSREGYAELEAKYLLGEKSEWITRLRSVTEKLDRRCANGNTDLALVNSRRDL